MKFARHVLALCVALMAMASPALAATLQADPATLAQVQAKALPGDFVQVADGQYAAPLTVTGKKGLTFVGGPGAVFPGFVITGSDLITLDGLRAEFTPDAKTDANTPITKVYQSTNITLRNLIVHGNMLPEGTLGAKRVTDVPAPGQDAAIVGYPLGRCVDITQSNYVTLEHSDLSGCNRGLLLKQGHDFDIRWNRIHHNRTTPIGCSALVTAIRIENNWLGESRSYRNPQGGGDHSDFIHCFTETKAGTPPVVGLVIKDNFLDQGTGQSMLGINLETSSTYYQGVITGNVQINDNTQAFTTGDFRGSLLDNRFYTPGAAGFPTIILRNSPVDQVKIEGNTLYERSAKPFLGAVFPGNTYLPRSTNVTALIAEARKVAAASPYGPVRAPPPVLTLEQRVGALEGRVTALEHR